jgi:hypothetical protein
MRRTPASELPVDASKTAQVCKCSMVSTPYIAGVFIQVSPRVMKMSGAAIASLRSSQKITRNSWLDLESVSTKKMTRNHLKRMTDHIDHLSQVSLTESLSPPHQHSCSSPPFILSSTALSVDHHEPTPYSRSEGARARSLRVQSKLGRRRRPTMWALLQKAP